MVQVLPQVRIFQEFTQLPTAIAEPLRALAIGPHYNVRTYAKAKSSVSLGAYTPDADLVSSWPARMAGEVVDLDYVRVFIDNAMIRYYSATSGGVGFDPQAQNKLVMGGSFGWAATTGFSRLAAIPKDVAVGDYVKITSPTDATVTVTSQVRELVPAVVASILPAQATADASNPATPGSPGTATQFSTTHAGSRTLTLGASAFKGYINGNISDRYTFTVTLAGAIGVAKMVMTSDSGADSAAEFTTAAGPVSVGALGLTLSIGGSGSFVLGDKWIIDATSAFTAPGVNAVDVTGTYTGTADTTYVLTITEGGVVGTDTPKFTVSTTTGIDNSGPHDAVASATDIGVYGAKVSFDSGSNLSKGAKWTILATAATTGRISTLVLADTLSSTLVALSDVNVEVFAKKNVEITKKRYNAAGVANWTATATAITLEDGITHYDAADSVLTGKPIRGGTAYVGYRALVPTHAGEVKTISDTGSLGTYFSDLTPENPLGFAVKQMLANANGTDVKFIAVATNDIAGYTTALGKTLEREDVYSFVGLTQDEAILNAIDSHVKSQSTEEKGRWRISWRTAEIPTIKQVVGTASTLATITNYPGDAGTKFRLVTAAGASFITNGVKANDVFRYAYTTDAFGAAVYATDVVDTVISETQILVFTGPTAAVNAASKIEIWRNLTTDEQVSELVLDNTAASRRVYQVLAGGATVDGYANVADYYVAAACAGLRSASAPHQGLTNVALAGISATPFTKTTLTGTQLDTLMNAGFWIVTQDAVTGDIYTRKQISTDLTDLNTTEQSATTNIDSLSYYWKKVLAPYIGKTNNVDSNHALIRGDLEASFEFFFNNGTPNLGTQILEGTTIKELRAHATLRDRLVVVIGVEQPYPLNNIDAYIVVG